jgi:hypothetical protein
MTLLILLGLVALVMVGVSFKTNSKVQKFLDKHNQKQYLPKAISMLILTAQVSELIRVVEHTNFVNITAALMLLAIVVATKRSGSEDVI